MITRSQLKVLRDEMQKALDTAGIKNFEFEIGNMRYTDVEVTIKVQAKIKGVKGRADVALERAMKQHGLQETNSRGDKLVTFNSAARKYPFVYATRQGKRYKTDLFGAKARFTA